MNNRYNIGCQDSISTGCYQMSSTYESPGDKRKRVNSKWEDKENTDGITYSKGDAERFIEEKVKQGIQEAKEGKLVDRGIFKDLDEDLGTRENNPLCIDLSNPKDSIGSQKDMIGLVPPEGIRQISKAMRYGAFDAPRADGSSGYGAYNWRDTKVRYTVYLNAVLRHALALVEKDDLDSTSQLNHWAHIGANAVLILDALKQGQVIDDRLQEQK